MLVTCGSALLLTTAIGEPTEAPETVSVTPLVVNAVFKACMRSLGETSVAAAKTSADDELDVGT